MAKQEITLHERGVREMQAKPLSVWLRMPDEDGKNEAEAYILPDGSGMFRVEWKDAVPLAVESRRFATLGEACDWLEAGGFEPYQHGVPTSRRVVTRGV